MILRDVGDAVPCIIDDMFCSNCEKTAHSAKRMCRFVVVKFEFLYKKYARKYEGYELKFRLKRRLSEDGFNYGNIKEVMDDFFGE